MFTNKIVCISLGLVLLGSTVLAASSPLPCRDLEVVSPDDAPNGKYFYSDRPSTDPARDTPNSDYYGEREQIPDHYNTPDVQEKSDRPMTAE